MSVARSSSHGFAIATLVEFVNEIYTLLIFEEESQDSFYIRESVPRNSEILSQCSLSTKEIQSHDQNFIFPTRESR
jgi:hypothetical protein